MQNKEQELIELKARLVELYRVMSRTDHKAVQCVKRGWVFGEKYPEEQAEYIEAYEEYIRVEERIKELEN